MPLLKNLYCIVFIAASLLGCTSVSAQLPVTPEQRVFEHDQSQLNVIRRLGDGNDIIVFIHGTPGDATAFQEYLSQPWLLPHAKAIISIDRPAWGSSLLKHNDRQVLSLAQQSTVIGDYLMSLKKQYPAARIIVVGHSLGGSLLARLLGDYPNDVDAGLILAGTINPELAQPRWYHNFAKSGLIKRMIGADLAKSNLEMLSLEADVAAAESNYSQILQPVTVIQGRRDKLVSYKNADYAKRIWPQSTVVLLPESGHFLPWQQQGLIVSHIKQLQLTLDKQAAH